MLLAPDVWAVGIEVTGSTWDTFYHLTMHGMSRLKNGRDGAAHRVTCEVYAPACAQLNPSKPMEEVESTEQGEPYVTGEWPDTTLTWTAEACLAAFQAANDQYWAEHNLSMTHSALLNVSQTPATASPPTLTTPAYPSYELLPQRKYVAKRRFRPEPPILFRTASAPYVKLVDALSGKVGDLNGGDDAVLLGEHLTQKQSLRLEIAGHMSFERQINVRSPSNSFRPITKARLAEKLAREIYDYMNRHQNEPLGATHLNVGPGTRGFERLVLLELCHVSKASWQPVLGVLQPSQASPLTVVSADSELLSRSGQSDA
ncbi:hypothetical protein OH77DRAFT_1416106 [Trametes cingulata]|nr:hypothetical protein OH77DRAFT_1416106 [Trametes cingulata]